MPRGVEGRAGSVCNGDNQKAAAAADEIQQSVDLAYESLMKTGKNPRNSPRWFKAAEISTRDLSKKLKLSSGHGFRGPAAAGQRKARCSRCTTSYCWD